MRIPAAPVAAATALLLSAPAAGVSLPAAQPVARFVPHTIATGLAGGYQVVVADLNRDGWPDVLAVAADLDEFRWCENPGWRPHVLMGGIRQPINAAAWDVDDDGVPDVALAHEFSTVYAERPGVVSILTHQGDPTRPWSIKEIDRVPTSQKDGNVSVHSVPERRP